MWVGAAGASVGSSPGKSTLPRWVVGRPNHPKVRSTTQRRGSTANRRRPRGRRTIASPHPVGPGPTAPAGRRSPHQPRSTGAGAPVPAVWGAPAWLRRGLGYPLDAPPPPTASPAYRPRYVACAPSPSCPRHSCAAPFPRSFDRLAIDDRRTRDGLMVGALPRQGAQRFMDPSPGAVLPPGAEIPPDGAPGREVMGQCAPGAAVAEHVQDPVEHLPQVHAAGSVPGQARGPQWGKHPPLGGGEVCRGLVSSSCPGGYPKSLLLTQTLSLRRSARHSPRKWESTTSKHRGGPSLVHCTRSGIRLVPDPESNVLYINI